MLWQERLVDHILAGSHEAHGINRVPDINYHGRESNFLDWPQTYPSVDGALLDQALIAGHIAGKPEQDQGEEEHPGNLLQVNLYWKQSD